MTATEPARLKLDFLVAKFGSREYSPNRPNENALHLSRRYSKAILNQLQGDQKIEVRTGVDSRNHVEVIPAQAEACTDNTAEYTIRMIFYTVERDISTSATRQDLRM